MLGTDDLYREMAYVAMSRGRHGNHLYIVGEPTRQIEPVHAPSLERDVEELTRHGVVDQPCPDDGIRTAQPVRRHAHLGSFRRLSPGHQRSSMHHTPPVVSTYESARSGQPAARLLKAMIRPLTSDESHGSGSTLNEPFTQPPTSIVGVG